MLLLQVLLGNLPEDWTVTKRELKVVVDILGLISKASFLVWTYEKYNKAHNFFHTPGLMATWTSRDVLRHWWDKTWKIWESVSQAGSASSPCNVQVSMLFSQIIPTSPSPLSPEVCSLCLCLLGCPVCVCAFLRPTWGQNWGRIVDPSRASVCRTYGCDSDHTTPLSGTFW